MVYYISRRISQHEVAHVNLRVYLSRHHEVHEVRLYVDVLSVRVDAHAHAQVGQPEQRLLREVPESQRPVSLSSTSESSRP